MKRTLRTEELARDVKGFTSHDDDLLAVKQLLRNSAGQATKEVSLAVDDDLKFIQHVSACISSKGPLPCCVDIITVVSSETRRYAPLDR